MKNNLTIMLVDDSQPERILFSYVLKEIDNTIEYIPIEDGQKAIHYFTSNREIKLPDYLFLDANMPEMDGIECLEKLKNLKIVNKVPVIIYTTYSTKSYKETAKVLGAAQCLRKAIDFNKTCKDIASIIEGEAN